MARLRASGGALAARWLGFACVLVLASCASVREPRAVNLPAEVVPAEGAPCLEFGAQARLSEAMQGKPEGFAEERVESLRRARSLPPAAGELPADASRMLSMAAEALARGDAKTALTAAREAARFAPERVEPLEVQLLSQLSSGALAELRQSVEAIRAIDAGNTIVLAFDGLSAAQSDRPENALGALAWFFGADPLPRRGAVIPLPTAVGELEEQAAVAALALGRARAALDALDAAALARSGQEPAVRALAIMRADALDMLGRHSEAEQALRAVAGAVEGSEPADGLSMLAALHLDALRARRGRMVESAAEALASLAALPEDDARLARFVRCVTQVPPDSRAKLAERAAQPPVGGTPLRAALVAALLDPRGGGRVLERALGDSIVDRAALRHACVVLSSRNAPRAAELGAWLASAHPVDLDAVSAALLGAGVDIDELMAALASAAPQAAADALRSRMLSRYGFPEDAYAVAAAARARDRASPAALAACALAAAELSDEVLVADVDEDPAAAPVARVVAAAWLALGRAEPARVRALQALAGDSLDARAEMIAALASLGDVEQREAALSTLRRIAQSRAPVAIDAASRLAMELSSEGGADEELAAITVRDPVARVRRAMAEIDTLRLPVSLELRALAEELDATRTSSVAVVEGAATPADRRALARWTADIMRESPADPSRRRVAAAAGRRADNIPAAPLSARFDALATATPAMRTSDALLRATARPRTAAALAAQAKLAVEANDMARAASVLAGIDPFTVSSGLSARALLGALGAVAEADRSAASSAGPLLEACISRLGDARPEDLLAASRAAIAIAPSSLPSVAARIAPLLEPPGVEAFPAYADILRELVEFDSDPYAAAQVAAALAAEPRFSTAARSRFGTSATALFAAAGADAEEIERFVRALVAEGAAPFRRDEEIAMSRPVPLAEILVRASGAFSMVGDEAGSEALLRKAVAEDGALANALNNLAYIEIDRGTIGDATVAMAEKAATLAPDDPAVLDTVGFLRYHQGRLRDGPEGAGAISLLRQALRLKPNDPSLATLDHLGDALWRDGDQEGAIRCWRQIEQVAQLRYPPEPLAKNLVEYQRREFGVELVDPAQYIRRNYGTIVERARRKLEQIARGEPPAVADCRALR
ncbi:MAG: hypothetical protein LW636_02380 [Planctomycetaceae bacterium]|nr:hypothetical protein [Planctomycetaceae bacterium]